MAQKPKSSAKLKKAVVKKVVKSAPVKKAKVTTKPTSIKKAAVANHKASPKISVKPKAKSADLDEQEPQRPLIRMPKDAKTAAFFVRQKQRLLELRDHFLDQMQSVAQDSLRSRSENNEASAVGQHQADAGSDAYEKDFALSLLSQEQDALYEIEEALKRIEAGSYGVCEMSNKFIPHTRLEAIPFARFTVECQQQLEKENRGRRRWDTAPQFMDSAEAVQLAVEITAEAGFGAQFVGQIRVALLAKNIPAFRAGDLAQHLLHLRVGEHLIPNFRHVAMQPHLGWLAFLHVKIGGFGLNDDIEIIIDHDALVLEFDGGGHLLILCALARDADDFLTESVAKISAKIVLQAIRHPELVEGSASKALS